MIIKPLRVCFTKDVNPSRGNTPPLPISGMPRALRMAVLAGAMLANSLIVSRIHAQATTGDVVGTVVDASGSVIPGATVELTNVDTHERRTVVTGSAGEYTVTLLKPDRYSIAISRAGFKTSNINTFTLGAGDRAREDSSLQVGSADQTVEVVGQAPVLQYNRQLMQAILHDRLPIAKIVNATVIPLDQAPQGYQDFDKGAAKKYVLNPNGLIGKAA